MKETTQEAQGSTAEPTAVKRGRPVSKRHEIVRAAVKVFLENGYEGTSMNRVADEAGVIKATIYSHFKDKEQLFSAIFQEVVLNKVEVDFEKLEPHVVSLPIDQFIEALYTRFKVLENDPEYATLLRLLIGESGRFPELPEIYTKLIVNKGMLLAKKIFRRPSGVWSRRLACGCALRMRSIFLPICLAKNSWRRKSSAPGNRSNQSGDYRPHSVESEVERVGKSLRI